MGTRVRPGGRRGFKEVESRLSARGGDATERRWGGQVRRARRPGLALPRREGGGPISDERPSNFPRGALSPLTDYARAFAAGQFRV